MFGDLDWPLNASCGLSASAEFLILVLSRINVEDGGQDLSHDESLQVYLTHLVWNMRTFVSISWAVTWDLTTMPHDGFWKDTRTI